MARASTPLVTYEVAVQFETTFPTRYGSETIEDVEIVQIHYRTRKAERFVVRDAKELVFSRVKQGGTSPGGGKLSARVTVRFVAAHIMSGDTT